MKKLSRYIQDNEINLLAALLFAPLFIGILLVNSYAWRDAVKPESLTEILQVGLSLLWITPLPIALLSFVGILLYKTGDHLQYQPTATVGDHTVYFRLVTRGTNQETVTRTANSVIEVMEQFNARHMLRIPYVMEVVTEITKPPLERILRKSKWGEFIQVLEMPKKYETKNNAKYKARALHFALEASTARDSDWIFHLDDESQIDQITVLGIASFISSEEKKLAENCDYLPRIGQGTILYHRNIRESMLYTLADSIRTADDIGRYFLQYTLGLCIFGMHGSFILCRTSVEKVHGFDLAPEHCITEDAYWGLAMMQLGYRFGHVYGYVHEQSPAKSSDFIKQRRRWFLGMTKVLQSSNIKMQYKFILIASTILWSLSGFVVMYTAINILHPVAIPYTIGILSSLAFAIYVLMYIVGFYVNIRYASIPLYRKAGLFIAQVVFMPIFSMLESAGSLYGLFDRKLNFYVIKK